jgi:hypothetical protein
MSEAQHIRKPEICFNHNPRVGTILVVSRVDVGVARQQQLGDFNFSKMGGEVQRSAIAEDTTKNQNKMPET